MNGRMHYYENPKGFYFFCGKDLLRKRVLFIFVKLFYISYTKKYIQEKLFTMWTYFAIQNKLFFSYFSIFKRTKNSFHLFWSLIAFTFFLTIYESLDGENDGEISFFLSFDLHCIQVFIHRMDKAFLAKHILTPKWFQSTKRFWNESDRK